MLRNFRLAMMMVAVFAVAAMALYGCTSGTGGTKEDTSESTQMPGSGETGDGMAGSESGSRDTMEEPGSGESMSDVELPVAPKELADVYFDFDKYDIKSSEVSKMDGNAAWIKKNSDKHIIIEGHCDERGTVAYNLALGERRAMAAKNYLASLGVPSSSMSIVSYGEERPADPGHNEAAWAKNRRAHFLASSARP